MKFYQFELVDSSAIQLQIKFQVTFLLEIALNNFFKNTTY